MSQAPLKVSFPRLDPLRALCFLLVFFFHAMYTTDPVIRDHWSMHLFKGYLFGSGHMGVNVFFVLSGFLITYLLIAEKHALGRIDAPRFWLRRILRIWPLYYACVAFGFLVFPLIKQLVGLPGEEGAHPLWYLVFMGNFDVIQHGAPDASVLGLLWSIAVEEQFYLVWPLVLAFTPQRIYPYLFGALIAGAWVFCRMNPSEDMIHYHTLARMGDLACGAMGAWAAWHTAFRARLAAMPVWGVWLMHLIFFGLLLGHGRLEHYGIIDPATFRTLFSSFATGVVVWQAVGRADLLALPDVPVLNYMGRISYGLYCLHSIGLLIAVQGLHMLGMDTQVWHVVILQTVVGLGATITIAALSYRFLESPFLKLKDRFAHIHR